MPSFPQSLLLISLEQVHGNDFVISEEEPDAAVGRTQEDLELLPELQTMELLHLVDQYVQCRVLKGKPHLCRTDNVTPLQPQR